MVELGSDAHRALIGHVIAHYENDDRILGLAVFGSVAAGTWHAFSDVDLDVVIADDAAVVVAHEVDALFGARAAISLLGEDSADVVLESLEELSIRWHSLGATSPNISATVHVVAGQLADADIAAAGEANRTKPDEQRLLDALVRDAVGVGKAIRRGRLWEAASGVERMRASLLLLRGRRDSLTLNPADPADGLAQVLAETRAAYDLGSVRSALLERMNGA